MGGRVKARSKHDGAHGEDTWIAIYVTVRQKISCRKIPECDIQGAQGVFISDHHHFGTAGDRFAKQTACVGHWVWRVEVKSYIGHFVYLALARASK